MDLICHPKWRFTSADIVFITINSNVEEEFLNVRERSAIDEMIDTKRNGIALNYINILMQLHFISAFNYFICGWMASISELNRSPPNLKLGEEQ